jgi:hypothetical protein
MLAPDNLTRIPSADALALADIEASAEKIAIAVLDAVAVADTLAAPDLMRTTVAVALAEAEPLAAPSNMQVFTEVHIKLSSENARVSKLPPNRSSCSSVYGPQISAMLSECYGQVAGCNLKYVSGFNRLACC